MTTPAGLAVLIQGIMTTEQEQFHRRLRRFVDLIADGLVGAGVAVVKMAPGAVMEGEVLEYAVLPYPAGAMYINELDLADETGAVATRRVLTTQVVAFLAEPPERADEVAAILDRGMVGLEEEFPHSEWQFTDPAEVLANAAAAE